jgi:hypothetical protein
VHFQNEDKQKEIEERDILQTTNENKSTSLYSQDNPIF